MKSKEWKNKEAVYFKKMKTWLYKAHSSNFWMKIINKTLGKLNLNFINIASVFVGVQRICG